MTPDPGEAFDLRALLIRTQARLHLTNRALADRLGVSERTTERYRQGTVSIRGPIAVLLRQMAEESAAREASARRANPETRFDPSGPADSSVFAANICSGLRRLASSLEEREP